MNKDDYVRQIEAHSGSMYRIAKSLLRNDEDCKDAMQEAAQKAWEKRGSLRKPQYFGTWLVRILINECHNTLRTRKRLVLMENLPDIPVPPDNNHLLMVLEGLPEKYRLPLVLKYSEGMNEAEIAKALRLPQSTVRGRIYRARLMLKKELDS